MKYFVSVMMIVAFLVITVVLASTILSPTGRDRDDHLRPIQGASLNANRGDHQPDGTTNESVNKTVEHLVLDYVRAAQNGSKDVMKYISAGLNKEDPANPAIDSAERNASRDSTEPGRPKQYDVQASAIETIGHEYLAEQNPLYIRRMGLEVKDIKSKELRPSVYSVQVSFESSRTGREVTQEYIVRLEKIGEWKILSVLIV